MYNLDKGFVCVCALREECAARAAADGKKGEEEVAGGGADAISSKMIRVCVWSCPST